MPALNEAKLAAQAEAARQFLDGGGSVRGAAPGVGAKGGFKDILQIAIKIAEQGPAFAAMVMQMLELFADSSEGTNGGLKAARPKAAGR
jgi:hypothetical protein